MLCVCLLGRASCLRTPRAALFLFLVQTTLEALWLQFRDELSEDFLAKVSDVDARHQAALHELNAILGRWGKTTADVGLPLPGKFDKARPSQHYDSNAFLWLGPFLGWFLVCRLFVSCGPLFILLAHMLSICLHACGLFFGEVSSTNLVVSCQRQTGFTNGIIICSPAGHSGGTGRF